MYDVVAAQLALLEPLAVQGLWVRRRVVRRRAMDPLLFIHTKCCEFTLTYCEFTHGDAHLTPLHTARGAHRPSSPAMRENTRTYHTYAPSKHARIDRTCS